MKRFITYIQSLMVSFWLLFATRMKKEDKKQSKRPLKLDLQFFAEGGEGGDGGSDGDGGEGSSGEGEPFATFKTREDLNKRLSRAEKKGQKELAAQLGYDSVEDMLAALKKPEPNKTPNNKNKTDDEPVDVEQLLEEKLKEERQKTFKRLVTSEVKVMANELGFADWEDALALADLSQVKEDDKGNITGVKEALEALAKKKPHLLKQQSNNRGAFGAPIPNGGNGQGGNKNLEEVKKLAQNRGVSQNTAYNPWA